MSNDTVASRSRSAVADMPSHSVAMGPAWAGGRRGWDEDEDDAASSSGIWSSQPRATKRMISKAVKLAATRSVRSFGIEQPRREVVGHGHARLLAEPVHLVA